jgi:hypothetical protein
MWHPHAFRTTTVIYCDNVNSVTVDDSKISVGWRGVAARVSRVTKLDSQTQLAEGGSREEGPVPFLQKLNTGQYDEILYAPEQNAEG